MAWPRRWLLLGGAGALVTGGFAWLAQQGPDIPGPSGAMPIETHRHDMGEMAGRARTIRLATAGPVDKPAVLFIHGSPGSWEAWAQYLEDPDLRAAARMIAVDRPGFGGSAAGGAEPSMAVQAALIAEVAQTHAGTHAGTDAGANGDWIVVGHSLGGPVAVQLALDRPDLVGTLILLAPSIDPELEVVTWYQRLATQDWMRPLVPGALETANDEILPLAPELAAQTPRLAGLTNRVIVIQGQADRLVPEGNADYAEREFVNADLETVRLPDQGHFLPWERYDLVRRTILDELP
ncbi:MAG: alpha/beta fold hydrolase [Pseudomonadota bacterium]